MTEEEIDSAIEAMNGEMLSHTRSKPWTGGPYVPGRAGGTWYDSVMTDPKTFNHYIAERDASSSSLIAQTTDFLFDYDPTLRKWSPRAASYAIDIDKQNKTIDEESSFATSAAQLSADGAFSMSVDLASVKTNIDLRDERLRDWVFEVAQFPKAEISGKIDMNAIGSLKTGGLLFMAAGGTCPIALGATMLKSPATYIRTAPCLRRAWCWNFC